MLAGEMEKGVRRALHSAAGPTRGGAPSRHAPNHAHLSGVPSSHAAETIRPSQRNHTMKCNLPSGPSLVDAHFAGNISPARERELRSHLPACETCRDYYERHLLLTALDPAANKPQDRLGVGLGIAPSRRPSRV